MLLFFSSVAASCHLVLPKPTAKSVVVFSVLVNYPRWLATLSTIASSDSPSLSCFDHRLIDHHECASESEHVCESDVGEYRRKYYVPLRHGGFGPCKNITGEGN